MISYWVVQILGGILGALWVMAINGDNDAKIFGGGCTDAALSAANVDGSTALYGCNSCTLPRPRIAAVPAVPASGSCAAVAAVAAQDTITGAQVFGCEFLATSSLYGSVSEPLDGLLR